MHTFILGALRQHFPDQFCLLGFFQAFHLSAEFLVDSRAETMVLPALSSMIWA